MIGAAMTDTDGTRGAPGPAAITCIRGIRLGLITSQAFSLHNFRGPLIREWTRRGIEVFALAPDYDEATRSAVRRLGATPVDYRLSRAAISPGRDALDLLALIALLRRLRLDMTLSYFIKPVIYGTLAARLVGVGSRYAMVEGAGYVFSDDGGGGSLRRSLLQRVATAMYRISLTGADRVLFLNRDDVELFLERRAVRPEQVALIGGIGVELDHYAPVAPVLEPVTFLLAARLLEHKGVRDFVEAARLLRQRYPDVRFILLGSPDLNPGSIDEPTLRGWHSEGVIEWRPHRPDVRPTIASASVFVLPSWYREGVPRSIQEAMAMGRPIVTTDMPGCRDTVEDGVNGFLTPPRDVPALVERLRRFIETPELIRSMGEASRRRAEALYDVRRSNRAISRTMGLDSFAG